MVAIELPIQAGEPEQKRILAEWRHCNQTVHRRDNLPAFAA